MTADIRTPADRSAPALRLAVCGIDHPHGHGWRELLRQFPEIEVVALLPGFGGATTSLEERLSHVPRFTSVEELLANAQFDAALVCLSNREGPQVLDALARAGKHILAEKPLAARAAALKPAAATTAAFQSGYMWRYD